MPPKIKTFVPLVFIGIFILVFWLGTRFISTGPQKGEILAAGSVEKFDFLSSQNSNQCGLQAVNLDSYPEDGSLQGSCCGAMDLHRYQEQVEGLEKYSEYEVVPVDPYDISVSLAKKLFEYQKTITLNEEQQKIYDEAMKMSHEGGPCCCRCWRWTAFEGQAKYLISQHSWASEQIAGLWDMEDGCGGEGHEGHT